MDTETSVIKDVRRKIVIDRHRPVIGDMEASLSDGFVDGTLEHPRLQAMLRELDEESEQNRIAKSRDLLLTDDGYRGLTIRDALIEYLCEMRERHDTEVATLQMHAVGVYRAFRELIRERRGWTCELDDLRAMTIDNLRAMQGDERPAFACVDFAAIMACPPMARQRSVSTIRAIRQSPIVAPRWEDDSQSETVPREIEEQVADLPEQDRRLAIKELLADRIRSTFYQAVFCRYFHRDAFDPASVDGVHTLLDWVEAIRETPHLFPFMQGQSQEQKNFRLAQLVGKIIQLCEMYQRIARARADASLGDQLSDKDSRTCLSVLAKEKYPPGSVDEAFIAAVFQYPLLDFVAWIQDLLAAQDFVLPPEPRKSSSRLRAVSARLGLPGLSD